MRFSDITMPGEFVDLLHTWRLQPSSIERCALAWGVWCPSGGCHVAVVEEVPNRSATPENHFQIERRDAVCEEHIVGVIHTHLQPWQWRPSMEDIKGIPANNFGIIVNFPADVIVLFDCTGWLDEIKVDIKDARNRLRQPGGLAGVPGPRRRGPDLAGPCVVPAQ